MTRPTTKRYTRAQRIETLRNLSAWTQATHAEYIRLTRIESMDSDTTLTQQDRFPAVKG